MPPHAYNLLSCLSPTKQLYWYLTCLVIQQGWYALVDRFFYFRKLHCLIRTPHTDSASLRLQSRLYQVLTSLVRLPISCISPFTPSIPALGHPQNWLFALSPLLVFCHLPPSSLAIVFALISWTAELWLVKVSLLNLSQFPFLLFLFSFFSVTDAGYTQTWDAPWRYRQQLRTYQAPGSFPTSGNLSRWLSIVVCCFPADFNFHWPVTFLPLTGQDRREVEQPLHVGSVQRTKEEVVVRRKKWRKLKIVRKFQVGQT